MLERSFGVEAFNEFSFVMTIRLMAFKCIRFRSKWLFSFQSNSLTSPLEHMIDKLSYIHSVDVHDKIKQTKALPTLVAQQPSVKIDENP